MKLVPILLIIIAATSVYADELLSGDEPSRLLSVQDLSGAGLHFEALVTSRDKQSPMTLTEQVAAARSAWALGLPDSARALWDEALANSEFQGLPRTRELLARAILELQEKNYETARVLAEQGADGLEPSDLRAQFWLIAGEALRGQDATQYAEEYYKRAFDESSGATKSEAAFLLGECQLKLGMSNEARFSLAAVGSDSKYSPLALMRLIEIDLNSRNYEAVLTWVEEGRKALGTNFESGDISYSYIMALLALNRLSDSENELARMKLKLSENDAWVLLAEAAVISESVKPRGGTARAQLALSSGDEPVKRKR